MAYRFKTRSTTPGDYRWVTGFFAGIPIDGNVREGIDTGDGITGVLVLPSITSVESGVAYGSGSVELTGTFEGAGASDYPDVTNVRYGTVYGSAIYTGTLDLPSINNVVFGTIFDGSNLTGIFVVPAISQVEDGVEYGALSEYTGTLTGMGSCDYPSIYDVQLGVVYSDSQLTGVLELPSSGNVRLGVGYGYNDEYLGTLWLPTISNVKQGIGYGELGTEYVGTYLAAGSVPGASTLITSAFKDLYIAMINEILADDGLTVPCTLIYGDTKFTDCPNCIYDAVSKKSSNRYQTDGPIFFDHGVCPYCHGLGKLPSTSEETVYLASIFDSKSWIKWSSSSLTPHTPEMFVQTISRLDDTYTKLKKAKEVIIDTTVNDYTISRYKRYGEPEPVGLGNSTFIITMWEKI